MNTTVFDRDAIARAVAALRAGLLVAFPTETVYGLGANARDPAAVARLYAAKGRPADHPVIVHVANARMLAQWAREIPPAAQALAARFWPGPLTLVLKRALGVRDAITGGQDTVALRCPDHPLAQALLEAAQAAGIDGIVAPSANRFGRISPTTAAHVVAELGDAVAVVLDGGPCRVGIESTIVDLSSGPPRILRPGMIAAEDLEACIGALAADQDVAAPRVSGVLPSHYAPRTPLELVPAEDCVARVAALSAQGEVPGVFAPAAVVEACALPARALIAPREAEAYARCLYANLRALDDSGCTRIVVALPADGAAWRGIRDRLARAAH
ncbi:MAG TPA: L-threonylcarbamoyladenylate synthase [Gammaproteobacteria bacterium]|nr:L-threonylcarbamoyladenylate synthase [Gammaproteobacteria bacterium]